MFFFEVQVFELRLCPTAPRRPSAPMTTPAELVRGFSFQQAASRVKSLCSLPSSEVGSKSDSDFGIFSIPVYICL